jgi:hypothetical protein
MPECRSPGRLKCVNYTQKLRATQYVVDHEPVIHGTLVMEDGLIDCAAVQAVNGLWLSRRKS